MVNGMIQCANDVYMPTIMNYEPKKDSAYRQRRSNAPK